MNFNRIQKYRSEKAIPQLQHLKTGSSNPSTESSSQVTNNNRLNHTHKREFVKRNQQPTNYSQQSYIQAKGITLRDYLYLTSKSSKKSASIDNSKNSSLQSKSQHSNNSKRKHQRSGSLSHKEKYQASNAQIFEIVKTDIKKDLGGLQSIVGQLQKNFNSIAEYQYLGNSKMIQIYNFRKIIRENLMKQLKKLNEMLIRIKGEEKQEKQMPIIFEKDEEQRYEIPIQSQCNVHFEAETSGRRFINRSYSLKQ